MGDRELLEWAAKAAGIEIAWDARGPYEIVYGISGNCRTWNPLTNDGDALRLAVKLKLGMSFDRYSNSKRNTPAAEWFTDIDFYGVMPSNAGSIREEKHGADPFAATRRAIVRAAAEIGKATGAAK